MKWGELSNGLGRNDLPARLWHAYLGDEFDSVSELAVGIEDAWTSAEFPERLLPEWEWNWLELFSAAGYLEGATRAPRPHSPLVLYRGAAKSRRRGMAWTCDLDRAAWFAKRFGGGGCVWRTFAPPLALLAHFASRNEDEFVLDTSHLSIRRHRYVENMMLPRHAWRPR